MRGTKKIIFIEGDQIMINAIKAQLEEENFEILVAMDGESGVNIVTKEKPDLVVLDLVLPKMHGLDVLEVLKKDTETSGIPVLILTNLGQTEDIKKGLKLGASDYYVKSDTSLDKIDEKIKELLF